jgi:hypothetical protein
MPRLIEVPMSKKEWHDEWIRAVVGLRDAESE